MILVKSFPTKNLCYRQSIDNLQYYVKYDIIISDEQFLLRFISRKQTTKNALLRKEEKLWQRKFVTMVAH